jgi:hypothetical protein
MTNTPAPRLYTQITPVALDLADIEHISDREKITRLLRAATALVDLAERIEMRTKVKEPARAR